MAALLKQVVLTFATTLITCLRDRHVAVVATWLQLTACLARGRRSVAKLRHVSHRSLGRNRSQTRFKRPSRNRHLWDSNPRGEIPSA